MRIHTSPSHKETRVCERGLLPIIFEELEKMKRCTREIWRARQRQRQTLEKAVPVLENIKSIESWELQSLSRSPPAELSACPLKAVWEHAGKDPGITRGWNGFTERKTRKCMKIASLDLSEPC